MTRPRSVTRTKPPTQSPSGYPILVTEGVLRTIGSKRVFGDFLLAQKVTRRRQNTIRYTVGYRQNDSNSRQKETAAEYEICGGFCCVQCDVIRKLIQEATSMAWQFRTFRRIPSRFTPHLHQNQPHGALTTSPRSGRYCRSDLGLFCVALYHIFCILPFKSKIFR